MPLQPPLALAWHGHHLRPSCPALPCPCLQPSRLGVLQFLSLRTPPSYPPANCRTAADVLMARGSITLSEVPADGQPHPATIKMKRWCGATAGQPAGELAVELRLRQRRGSRRGGLARCPSGAGSDAGLLSHGSSSGSGSGLSCSVSGPIEDRRR